MVQAMANQMGSEYMRSKKTMEINPDNPIVAALNQRVLNNTAGVDVCAPPSLLASFLIFSIARSRILRFAMGHCCCLAGGFDTAIRLLPFQWDQPLLLCQWLIPGL